MRWPRRSCRAATRRRRGRFSARRRAGPHSASRRSLRPDAGWLLRRSERQTLLRRYPGAAAQARDFLRRVRTTFRFPEKTALLFGMEGGMYLGLITLQSPLLPGAPEAYRALRSGSICGFRREMTRFIRNGLPRRPARRSRKPPRRSRRWRSLRRRSPACIRHGEPGAFLRAQTPVLSVQNAV